MSEQKPIHVAKKPTTAMNDLETAAFYDAASKVASEKVGLMKPHFDDSIKLSWYSEHDEDEIRFYITATVSF